MTCELIILEKRTGKSWDIAPQVQKVTYTTNRTGSPFWKGTRSGFPWTGR